MTRSGLSMYLLQEYHAASKAGQALKLNSQGLREWCYCFFLQLQALHFDTGLLFPQAEKYELRQNWKKTNYLITACLQPVGNGPITPADTAGVKGCPPCCRKALLAQCAAPRLPHRTRPQPAFCFCSWNTASSPPGKQEPAGAISSRPWRPPSQTGRIQFHISPPSKACLESPLHTGSLRRQLPCTSCKIYTL